VLRGRVVESMPAERRLSLAMSFAGAARRYWLGVFPRVCLERRRRRARALRIPDPLLRRAALDAQCKWGNVEGAAAFAAFVPARHRAAAARAMTCFQAAYNYLDMLGEQPCADPVANGRRLHGALLAALGTESEHLDYYEHCLELEAGGVGRGDGGFEHRADNDCRAGGVEREAGALQREDGGYLREIVDSCREALATLPSYPLIAPAALRAAGRIVEFQSCNTGDRSELGRRGDLMALERWGRAHTPPGEDLRWWETAAAGGSSLGVFALIALAAEPCPDGSEAATLAAVAAVQDAYFPWIGALHSLLDNLVDVAEDRATGQHSLIGLYASPLQAAARMGRLAERSLRAARSLPEARAHTLVLSAMASFYLSTPEAATPAALPVARAVLGALDGPADLAMLVFRARLRVRGLLPGSWGRAARGAEVVMSARPIRPALVTRPTPMARPAPPARPSSGAPLVQAVRPVPVAAGETLAVGEAHGIK
jgi:tetraprenyl-beta-curcumene synthase